MWDSRIITYSHTPQSTSTTAYFNNTDPMVALSLFWWLHLSISNFNLASGSLFPRFDNKTATHFITYSMSYAQLIGVVVGYDTMLNYRLSQKFKILGNGKFNYLTIILTSI